ncbi:TolC family protein [Pseudothermotoga thermarum]|uniref:Outer membrane protein-like protein n=1 Tax=Pseudothermotoga thermarum DSM 5069 TaxID=688269 RepID=F7YX31_9THEM|nr:TolC family protein [Pseudothermotoga thermarum]AEH50737.1 outer membrane protein-like protein [Pseudothermotoga thermarum DSM 5069]
MKKFFILLLATFFLNLLVFASFDNLLNEALLNDSNYLSAKLDFENALFERKQKGDWYIPYFTIGGGTNNFEVDIHDETSYSLNIPLSLTFKNVYGFDISVGNSWQYDSKKNEWKERGWTISINRQLFTNFDIDDLLSLQKLENAAWNLLNARNNVFTRLIEEIFNDYYYNAKLEILNKQLEILGSQAEAIQEKYQAGIVSLEELLKTQKELQLLTQQLADLQKSRINISKSYSKEIFDQMIQTLEKITGNLPSVDEALQIARERADVKASSIALEIARRRYERAYQSFLPNPSFTASVKIPQDLSSDGKFSISLGFSVSYTLIDRGEKSNSYFKTLENYNIQQRIFEEKLSSLERDVKRAALSITIAEYSKKAADLDLSLAKLDYERTLKASEYLSEQDVEKAKIQLENAEVEAIKAHYSLLVAKINYLKAIGVDLINLVKSR